MKKITMILLLLVLMTSFSFAGTLTFKGESKIIPAELQGNWTQVAVSQNKGDTWIDGISVSLKLTKQSFYIADTPALTVLSVYKYTNDDNLTGYLLKFSGMEELFEFWFEDNNNIILLIHKNRIEVARCRLIR